MIRARTLPLAGVLLTLAALPAAAQQQGEMVPRELVMTLLGSWGSSSGPELLVGRLPAGFPAELAPAGARVVGSLARRSQQTAVFALSQPCPDAAAAYRRTLEGAGWTRPASAEMQPRGFLPASMGAYAPASSGYYCQGESRYAHFFTFPRDGGGSYLRVEVSPAGEHSPCSRRMAEQRVAFLPHHQVPLPALYAPEGAQLGETGMSASSGDSQEVSAQLGTPMPPAELVAHCAAQLRQAGWTPGGTGGGEGIALQTFARRDESGQSWHAVLSAVALPGTDKRTLSLRVSRLPGAGS